jgi:DNA (cytosine-5)-methyltransferase 1
MYTLTATDVHGVAIENHPNDGRMRISGVCQTLSSRMGTGGGNGPLTVTAFNHQTGGSLMPITPREECANTLQANQQQAVFHSCVRRLTPVECERLQGFPDNYTRVPFKKKTVAQCPDSHRYKALGNSMAVPCMKWIGERIQMVEDIDKRGKM